MCLPFDLPVADTTYDVLPFHCPTGGHARGSTVSLTISPPRPVRISTDKAASQHSSSSQAKTPHRPPTFPGC